MDVFEISIIGALGAGLLSFLSPCVPPLVPPYLCYLGGVSLEQISGEGETDPKVMRRVMLAALCFVLGFSTVFISLGATATIIGGLIANYMDVLSQIAGVIIIVLGLHFMGLFKIALLYREARFQTDSRPAGFLGADVVGLAFAFGWTPCSPSIRRAWAFRSCWPPRR